MVKLGAFLAPAVLLLSACGGASSGNPDAGPRPDSGYADGGGGGDAAGVSDASPPCAAGTWVCLSSGAASQCDGRGGLSQPVDCSTNATVCVPGLGCRVCAPGAGRCDPSNAGATQRCSDDGMSWLPGEVCDAAGGQVCDAGECRLPCGAGGTCEYWSTVTPASQLDPRFPFGVLLANAHDYPVSVTITGGGLAGPLVQSVMPHGAAAVELPWVQGLSHNRADCFAPGATSLAGSCVARSILVTRGAYHVESNGPVSVAQFASLAYRDDAGLALGGDASTIAPAALLGTRYVVAARGNGTHTITDAQGHPVGSVTLGGFFSVVGTDPDPSGTRVQVVLTAAARDPLDPTSVVQAGAHAYTLRRGDVLQFVGSAMGEDLTGSTVDAARPVAVFAGHDCAEVPEGRARCNHLEEQLLPEDALGQEFVVSQPRDRGTTERYRVRVVSAADGNELAFDGIAPPAECAAPLARGAFCEFETAKSFRVSGSGPMAVAQYALGLGDVVQCDTAPGEPPPDRPECAGSAAMTLVQPVEQLRAAYDFAVPDSFTLNLMNVAAPEGAQLLLDGVPLDQSSAATAGAGYRVYFTALFPGAHHVECTDPTQGFGLQVYGVAPWTQYMFPASSAPSSSPR